MVQPTLTLSFIFPGGADDFSVGYGTNYGVPVPVIGSEIGVKSGVYKVTARVWNYDSVGSLTIDITCG